MLRGANVVVIGQQSPKTLRGIAVDIEQFREVVGGFVRGGRQTPPMPTLVYAFDDRKALEPFVPLYQGKPASLGGYCHCGSVSDVNFIAVNLSSYADASVIIFHEYTHLLLRNAVSGIPVWLNEGLAEFYSTFQLQASGRHTLIGRVIPHHVLLLRERFEPLSQVVSVTTASALYNENSRRGIFYAEAWALAHYLMLERPNGVAAINQYLEEIGAGTAEPDAFMHAFGVSPIDMERELRKYVLRPAFKSVNFTLKERVDVDEPDSARTLASAEIEARLGDVQRRVRRIDEATPRIERAAAAGPEVAQAQLTLALLRLQQDRAAEAWPLLRKAAALASDDFFTQYTFGLSLLRANPPPGDAAEDPLELAHGALARAVALNPESAEALGWLAYADLVAGTRLPEAETAITKAIALSPGRIDYRLRLAEVFLRRNRVVVAQSLLSTIATSKGDGEAAAEARKLLDRIEARERERIASAATRRVVEPSPEAPARETLQLEPEAGARFVLRKVRAGEERAYGELVEIACAPGGVQFHLRVGTRVVVAAAPAMKDVELTVYGNDKDFMLACGARTPADTVLLTWRMKAPTQAGAATLVGDAVAVEFVPRGYVP